MTRSLTTSVIRTVAHRPDQQYGVIHVPHAASFSVVEQSMYAPEYVRALAALREHLWHERQLLQTSPVIERCAYFGPCFDLDQVPYDKIMPQQALRQPATHASSARGRCCFDCGRFTGSVQIKKEISLAKRTTLVPDEHDRTGTRKSGGAERDEHTECGHDGTENRRKPIQAEESEQQRHGTEHQARNRCLYVALENEVGTKPHDVSESAIGRGNNVEPSRSFALTSTRLLDSSQASRRRNEANRSVAEKGTNATPPGDRNDLA